MFGQKRSSSLRKDISTRLSVLIGRSSSSTPPQQSTGQRELKNSLDNSLPPAIETPIYELEQVLNHFSQATGIQPMPNIGELDQQRIGIVMCGYDMCCQLGLPWQCQEYQIALYSLLRAQHPQSTKDNVANNRLLLIAALLVACRQLNLTMSSAQLFAQLTDLLQLNRMSKSAIDLLTEEIEVYVLPKLTHPFLITAQIGHLFGNFDEHQITILRFTLTLRCMLQVVYHLKPLQQILCCIGTAEFLTSSDFKKSWKIMEEMRKKGLIGDKEHAEVRCGIRALVNAITAVGWQKSDWAWHWLSSERMDPAVRDSVFGLLSRVTPLAQRPLDRQPSLIWLMAPTTLV